MLGRRAASSAPVKLTDSWMYICRAFGKPEVSWSNELRADCCGLLLGASGAKTLHTHCLLAGAQQVRIGATEAVLPLMLQRLLAERTPGTPFNCMML